MSEKMLEEINDYLDGKKVISKYSNKIYSDIEIFEINDEFCLRDYDHNIDYNAPTLEELYNEFKDDYYILSEECLPDFDYFG